MSLIGQRSAVISLGVSCQPASQIQLCADQLSAQLGDTLETRSLPFDWMIAPPDAVARLLRGPHVPAGQAELVVAHRPFWPRQGVWLWHDPVDNDDDFGAMQLRMQRRWDRLLGLRSLPQRVFVVANTQNNLPRLSQFAPRWLDFRLTQARMAAIVAAVEAQFGTAGNRFLFLGYAERLAADAHRAPWPLAVLEADSSAFEGDTAQWSAAFARHLA